MAFLPLGYLYGTAVWSAATHNYDVRSPSHALHSADELELIGHFLPFLLHSLLQAGHSRTHTLVLLLQVFTLQLQLLRLDSASQPARELAHNRGRTALGGERAYLARASRFRRCSSP